MTPSSVPSGEEKTPIIGRVIEVLVADLYSQDGKIIGIPTDVDDRQQAGDEMRAEAMRRFKNYNKA